MSADAATPVDALAPPGAEIAQLARRRAEVDDPDADPVVRALQARVVFDHMFQFTGLTDLDGVLLDANQTALDAVGIDRSEVIGLPVWKSPWWTVDERTERDLREAIQHAGATGELVRYDVEVYATPAKQKLVPIDFSVRPARDDDGRVAFLVLEGRDISEKKEAERLKDQMFANVSHELRTPLSLILGRVERLLGDGGLPQEAADDLARTRDNALVLLDQVNTLLQVAALEQDAVDTTLVDVDLAGFVRRVADLFSAAIDERDQQLTMELPDTLPVRTDPEHLETVVRNLVGNAVKFTPAGGSIRVTLSRGDGDDQPGDGTDGGGHGDAGGDGGGMLRLRVADSGPGIPPEDRERVLSPFQRGADAEDGGAAGTGLGLAIVDRLVGLLGGRVAIGDAAEGGALVTVRLPHVPADDAGPATGTERVTRSPGGDGDRRVTDRAMAAADRLTGPGAVSAAGNGGPETGRTTDPADAPGGETAEAGTPAMPAPHVRGARQAPAILVVEDNADLSRFLSEELAEGHRLVVATDGREAVAMLEAGEADPDLIVTDVMMPRMDGRELIDLLPELGLADVPVLVLTAKEDQRLREELLAGGADDFLVKPFSSAELRARIANLLRPRLANQRLQELNEALQDHAHRLSHDLKTPLTTVAGMARTLADRGGELPADQRQHLLERIHAGSQRLHQMIEDILADATGATTAEPVDPGAVLDEVREVLEDTIRETGATVTTAGRLPGVLADPAAIHEVLLNVVTNSLRYRHPDRPPQVTVSGHRQGGEVVIAVADNGTGIADDDLERIFEDGARGAGAQEADPAGSGRGLHRARQVLARHDGTIHAEPGDQQGATIVFRLPAANPD